MLKKTKKIIVFGVIFGLVLTLNPAWGQTVVTRTRFPNAPRFPNILDKISILSENTNTLPEELVSFATAPASSDEILVKWRAGASQIEKNKILSKFGLRQRHISKNLRLANLDFVNISSLDEVIDELMSSGQVEYAEPNYIASSYGLTPNDPLFEYQWNLEQINAPEAWVASTGQGVVVAVIDTGVAYEKHRAFKQAPDLSGTIFVPGKDFVENDFHPNDDNGHGTHVAGTIAQTTNNSKGAAGVAYNASIMPIKVLDKNGSGTYDDVIAGIIWAADNGADIINLSLGGPPSRALEDAVRYAWEKSVLLVAATGNDGKFQVGYPAAYDDYVLAVGAVRYDKQKTNYSNYGPEIDLVAPGGDNSVDQNNDGYNDGILQETLKQNWWGTSTRDFGYYFYSGTSMAAPHVAGIAALLKSAGISQPDEIKDRLISSAEDLGAAGWDNQYGWGLVNAQAALGNGQGSASAANRAPTVSVGDPLSGPVGEQILFYGAATDPDGDILSYNWDFGDGASAPGQDTAHTYSQPGIYTVRLTVSDGALISTDQTTVTISALQKPQAKITGPNNAKVGEQQSYSAADSSDPDGNVVSYSWELNDGIAQSGADITQTFQAAGNYTLTLTVVDDDGLSDSSSLDVAVTEAAGSATAPSNNFMMLVEVLSSAGQAKSEFNRFDQVSVRASTMDGSQIDWQMQLYSPYGWLWSKQAATVATSVTFRLPSLVLRGAWKIEVIGHTGSTEQLEEIYIEVR